MTERTPLTTYRNSDLRVVYQFPQDTDLTDIVPSFFYRLEAGATPLLTVSAIPSVNGSSAVIIGTAVVVTLKIADLALFPAVDVWTGVYDSVLNKNGFVNKFVGGPLTQYVDGSYGDGTFADTVLVSIDGTEIPIIIEGGNLGASVGVGLAALNAAVKAAEDAAVTAAAAAQVAVAAAASIPALIAGKLDTDGDNADPALLANIGALDVDGALASPTILENIPYTDTEADAVPVDLQDYLSGLPINAATYGFVPDGADRSAEWQAAVAAAAESGRELYIPPGEYNVSVGATAYMSEPVSLGSSFMKGLRIAGSGMNRTIINSRVTNGWLLDVSVGDGSGGEWPFTGFKGVLGSYVKGITIRRGDGAVPSNSNGIQLRSCYQFAFSDMNVIGISGVGFNLKCLLGDPDANNQVSWTDVRVENTGGWGVDAGASAGHNENGFTSFTRTFWQNCGTAEQKAITGITQANPGVVTCVGHGFTTGQRVFIGGITTGMTQVNSPDAERSYVVTVVNANSFSIGVNTTGYTAWTAGGTAFPRTPSSGATRLKGQIVTFQSCAWTINKNRSVWIDGDGGGLPQDVFFHDSTIENPQLIGFHNMGSRGVEASGLHVYSNMTQAAGPNYWGHLYDGETNLVTDVEMNSLCVRTTDAETSYTAFQTIGANADRSSIRLHPENMHIKQFGTPGQTLFRGIEFDPIPNQASLTVIAGNQVNLRPDPFTGSGNTVPIRAAYGGAGGGQHLGAWIPSHLPTAGISITNAGLSANTTYNVYLYAIATASNTPALEVSATDPTMEAHGYMVKTGDPTRLWVGRVRTDASSQFITTGGAFLNPLRVSSPNAGLPSWLWVSQVDRKLYYKATATLPTTEAGGDYSYWPTFETSVAYDPPSIAAGATTTIDVTVVCGVSDYCSGVGFSLGWGGLTASGCVKAANTVTVTITNNTAGTIDLAAGQLRVAVQRR